MVEFLLGNGAYPDKANIHGRTPLHEAVFKGHKDVVQLLLDEGADPQKTSRFQEVPLSIAQTSGHMDIVQMMNEKIMA